MRGRADRILSGQRARRLVEAGGLLVRDGAAFRMYQRADERSQRCGRVPAHVVARLQRVPGLVAFHGDRDRLVLAGAREARWLKPLPVPPDMTSGAHGKESLLDQLAAEDLGQGVRLRAAAARFLADYHLAASPGRLRTDTPKALAAARERLGAIEAGLGTAQAELAEMLVVDRMTLPALNHVAGAGMAEARAALIGLAGAYGLLPDQEAGSALASA